MWIAVTKSLSTALCAGGRRRKRRVAPVYATQSGTEYDRSIRVYAECDRSIRVYTEYDKSIRVLSMISDRCSRVYAEYYRSIRVHAEYDRSITGWFRLNAQNCVPD